MRSAILLTAGVVAVLAAAAKLYHSRRDLRPTVLYLCATVACIGSSAALVAPISLTWISTWEPLPNLGRLVANLFAMLGAVCVHGLLAHLTHDDAGRRRRIIRLQVAVFAVAAVAMTVLMALADVPFTDDFVATYAGLPAVAAYGAVFSAQIGWAELTLGWFLRPYIARTSRRWLRAGLRTVQISTLFGVGWAVAKVVASVVAMSGGDPTVWDPVSGGLAGVCVLLMAVGSTLPFWGRVIEVPVLWLRASVLLRRLYPLWHPLATAVPQIKLPPLFTSYDARFALYRRVVEIRDAQLVLRPYVHPSLSIWTRQAAAEAGLTDRDVHQVVEAACLVAAVDAYVAEHRWRDSTEVTDTPYRELGSEPHAEAGWLIEVSRQVARSPIVREMRSRARAELPA